MRSKRVLILLALAGLAVVIGAVGFGFWLLTPNNHQAALVNVDVPNISSAKCLGRGASSNSGLRVDFKVDWVTHDDLVSVLSRLTPQGWQTISGGNSTNLLPVHRIVIDLWLFQVPVLRGISLSYTEAHATLISESTSLMLCPPVT